MCFGLKVEDRAMNLKTDRAVRQELHKDADVFIIQSKH